MAKWDDYGAWGSAGIQEVHDVSLPESEIGAVLRRLIDTDVARELSQETVKPLLKAVGVRSHGALMREAAKVSASRFGDELRLASNVVAPEGGGWVEAEIAGTLKLTDVSDAKLGKALRKAIAGCG
jgi:hypothetical protein